MQDQAPEDWNPGITVEVPAEAMAALCAAVSAETGIPEGRVRKVIQAAQRHQHTLGRPSPSQSSIGSSRPEPGSLADQLRYYPIPPNGYLFPAIGTDQNGSSRPWQA